MKTSKVKLYINGTLQTTTPIYSDDINIEMERESGEMFRRTKVSATITFLNNDYDKIYNSSLEDSFEVRFYDTDTSTNTDTFLARGTFQKTDCTFNTDDKICEVKVSSADDYDKILNGKDNEYDLVSLAPQRESVTLTKRAIIQIYVKGDTKVTDIIGNNSFEVDTNSSVDINGTSTPVEELTVAQLASAPFYFSIVKYVLNITVTPNSAVASAVPLLAGVYSGSITSGSSLTLTNENGYTLTLVQGSSLSVAYFKDANGNIVTYNGYNLAIRYTWTSGHIYVDSFQSSLYYIVGQGFTSCGSLSVQDLAFCSRLICDNDYYGTGADISSNDIVPNNLNYKYVYTYDVASVGSRIKESTDVQDEPTKWGVNADGKYFVKPSESGLTTSYPRYIPIGWNLWSPYSYWFLCDAGLYTIAESFDATFVLRDAYPLWSAIDVLLQKIDPTISFDGTSAYSQFLYGSVSYIPNYVSQLLYITPITNVKKTYYEQAARKGTITLENILNMLRCTFQLYWFIDENKKLRFEHILWFKNGGNYSQATPLVDLTSIKSYMSKKTWGFGQNTIEYDKSLLTKRYEFEWANDVSEPFAGYPIDIHNKFASDGSTEKASVTNFVSDIDFIISNPSAVSDDCFALIGTNSNKKCFIEYIDNLSMDAIIPYYRLQNAYLSFQFLELAYWVFDLGGTYATLEGITTSLGEEGMVTVKGTKRAKKQSVKFPLGVANVGKEGLIKTAIGSGEWVKSKYTLEDGMAEMELVLDTADDTLFSAGEIVKSVSGMSAEITSNSIVLNGGQLSSGSIFLFVTTNKNVTVTMTASSEANFDRGWMDSSPIRDASKVSAYASYEVSGNGDSVSFNMDAGEGKFFGYSKDASQYGFLDKITINFVER